MIEAGLVGFNQDQNQNYDFFREKDHVSDLRQNRQGDWFTGRLLLNKKEISKYLNSPDTDIFNKGRELFGLNVARQTIRNENRAYLVEGNFDVKRMHVIGVTGTNLLHAEPL